jgi:hypothetical protein
MRPEAHDHVGLIGTITSDHITHDPGRSYHGIGGILYQAAVLCGFHEEVFLYSNCGSELKSNVKALIEGWPTIQTG